MSLANETLSQIVGDLALQDPLNFTLVNKHLHCISQPLLYTGLTDWFLHPKPGDEKAVRTFKTNNFANGTLYGDRKMSIAVTFRIPWAYGP